nr:MAG TPA: hypothetical protein [Caudoviricetes sp.]
MEVLILKSAKKLCKCKSFLHTKANFINKK